MKSKDFFSQVIPLDSPTDHVKLRAFTDGNNIPYICEIPKDQDVVDIVAYVKKD